MISNELNGKQILEKLRKVDRRQKPKSALAPFGDVQISKLDEGEERISVLHRKTLVGLEERSRTRILNLMEDLRLDLKRIAPYGIAAGEEYRRQLENRGTTWGHLREIAIDRVNGDWEERATGVYLIRLFFMYGQITALIDVQNNCRRQSIRDLCEPMITILGIIKEPDSEWKYKVAERAYKILEEAVGNVVNEILGESVMERIDEE